MWFEECGQSSYIGRRGWMRWMDGWMDGCTNVNYASCISDAVLSSAEEEATLVS